MSAKTVSNSMNKLRLYTKTFHEHICKKLTGVLSDLNGVIGGDEVMGDSAVGSQFTPVDANNVNIVVKVFNISFCKWLGKSDIARKSMGENFGWSVRVKMVIQQLLRSCVVVKNKRCINPAFSCP